MRRGKRKKIIKPQERDTEKRRFPAFFFTTFGICERVPTSKLRFALRAGMGGSHKQSPKRQIGSGSLAAFQVPMLRASVPAQAC